MAPRLEADILAASQPLRVPGMGEQRVLSPVAVERIAEAASVPRSEVEATALEASIVPLHYLRNLAQFQVEGQLRLLRSTVAVVGRGPTVERLLELLALNGVGRLILCIPAGSPPGDAERLERAARNRNASTELETRTLALREGNPAAALKGADVVTACLNEAADEQLVQFACRMLKVPLTLGAVEERCGQATTVLPGDPGTALVYKPHLPHLSESRPAGRPDTKACLMVAAWLAEQVTALVLGRGELLRGRLLFADIDSGGMGTFELG